MQHAVEPAGADPTVAPDWPGPRNRELLAGLYDNVVRLLPPLVVTDAEVERALRILEEALAEVGA